MRRQTTREERLEDLNLRKAALEEKDQLFKKSGATSGSILEDTKDIFEAEERRGERAEIDREIESLERAAKSRGVVA